MEEEGEGEGSPKTEANDRMKGGVGEGNSVALFGDLSVLELYANLVSILSFLFSE